MDFSTDDQLDESTPSIAISLVISLSEIKPGIGAKLLSPATTTLPPGRTISIASVIGLVAKAETSTTMSASFPSVSSITCSTGS